MVLYLGIDEAGRGAVIGPLVMAGVEATEEQIKKLKNLHVRDSKKISKNQREQLYEEINKVVTATYIEIAFPKEIDEWVRTKNLNRLEEEMSKRIIKKSNTSIVIIDSFSANALSLASRLQQLFPKKKIIVEHKADDKYVIVGAASIIAKVVRDWHIKKLGEKYNIGSGYPSDPTTQQFLRENLNNKEMIPYIRQSWETIERVKKKSNQKTLFL